MAKNSKGQNVSNKKYYKKSTNKTTGTKKKRTTKVTSSKTKKTNVKRTYNKKPKKLENNVSIKVDDNKESLNYNILEEPVVTPEEENNVKYKADKKIKTQFKDEDKNLDDTKFLVVDDIKEEDKEYFEEPVIASVEEEPIEIEETIEKVEEPVVEESKEFDDVEPIITEEEPKIEIKREEKVETYPEEKPSKIEITKEEKIEATNINPEELEKYVLHNTQELKVITDDSGIYNNEDVDLPDDVKVYSNNVNFIKFVICLVVLFLLIILSIYSIISFSMRYVENNTVNNIAFHELSSVDYQVCDNSCIFTKQITNKSKSMKIDYSYEMQFDEKITYEANYTIVAELNIINSKDNNIVATDKSIIMKKDVKDKDASELNITQQIELELSKYRGKLKDYNNNNKTDYVGQLEVVMYVDGINKKERVSSIDIPMGNGEIDTQEISYNAGDASIENNKVASSKVYLYLIIGSFVVLLGSCIGVLFLLKSSNDTYEN